ncbi:Trp2 [Kluyveromyces lactis]|nr:Trp2 [Kluyveromyces lactis]
MASDHITIQPSIEVIKECIAANDDSINMYPVYHFMPAMDLTPHVAYLKMSELNNKERSPSFLFESANGNQLSRYSFFGHSPRKIIKTGPTEGQACDPLNILQDELAQYQLAENVPGLPKLSGGAIGYVSYDCVQYFEPKTKRPLKDVLQVPESALMLYDTIVAFDHVFQRFQIITNINVKTVSSLEQGYEDASEIIKRIIAILKDESSPIPLPEQPPIKLNQTFTSNIGQEGYEQHVRDLKEHIKKGDIIQCVPSQRVARPTSLHPFNIYKHLRTVNPSPYLFYIDYLDFQIIGASPELLCQVDAKNEVITHPIAGTVRRGQTPEEDDKLAEELRNSTKDRAEHVMLVDLARNDVNRVCDPTTTSVDELLSVQKFSHVQHLVSQVSGTLRNDQNRFDALRSIFPAGTVSGAPKVKAMELIGELEGEKRGVYAGAVGHWSYDGKSMDTCIALRTMVYKDGIAYLQAGGGIVFDSDPYDEYVETMNKMKANHNTILQAEQIWAEKVGTQD